MVHIQTSDINLILQDADIEGFCQNGSPQDEYAAEAQAIHAALTMPAAKDFDNKAITALIALVWQKQFNLSEEQLTQRLPEITAVAKKIAAIK
jgi:hypothetical protein